MCVLFFFFLNGMNHSNIKVIFQYYQSATEWPWLCNIMPSVLQVKFVNVKKYNGITIWYHHWTMTPPQYFFVRDAPLPSTQKHTHSLFHKHSPTGTHSHTRANRHMQIHKPRVHTNTMKAFKSAPRAKSQPALWERFLWTPNQRKEKDKR